MKYILKDVKYEAGDFWVSSYGPIEILVNLPDGYRLIEFLRTGNKYVVHKRRIQKRTVVDVLSTRRDGSNLLNHVVTNRQEADEYVRACQSERQ